MDEIKLVGISVRTNNTNEMDPDKAKIGSTIQKYVHENIAEKIKHRKKAGTTFSVYTNY